MDRFKYMFEALKDHQGVELYALVVFCVRVIGQCDLRSGALIFKTGFFKYEVQDIILGIFC